ncbi:hypothetical protein HNQ96_000725 [Aminobacter lissarensis]|uniref:Uncharacterized protein n=1 Tax=Aminobacter carboxidus TaxID=376165 RepID=A0A8E1WBD8_9HYPH|nr:hypothetical protein [Aminobacter lissarensis]MBB6464878.1 hypothetical protein [Aminobacter lissarensis]
MVVVKYGFEFTLIGRHAAALFVADRLTVAVGIKVHDAAVDRSCKICLCTLTHHQLDFDALTGRQRKCHFVGAPDRRRNGLWFGRRPVYHFLLYGRSGDDFILRSCTVEGKRWAAER